MQKEMKGRKIFWMIIIFLIIPMSILLICYEKSKYQNKDLKFEDLYVNILEIDPKYEKYVYNLLKNNGIKSYIGGSIIYSVAVEKKYKDKSYIILKKDPKYAVFSVKYRHDIHEYNR